MSVSYVLTTENGGYNFNLDTLVASTSGIAKLTHNGSGSTSNALPSLAVVSTSSTANDYVAGSTTLAGLGGLSIVTGDLLLADTGIAGAMTRLPIGSNGYFLTSNGTTAAWAAPATSGTVTSVAGSSSNFSVSGSPVTTSGNIALTLSTMGLASGGTSGTSQSTAYAALAPTTLANRFVMYNGSTNVAITGGVQFNALQSNGTSASWVALTPFINPAGAAANIGQALMTVGNSSVTVSTTAVSSTSIILITARTSTTANKVIYRVGTITDGVSFVINKATNVVTADVTLNWTVLNP